MEEYLIQGMAATMRVMLEQTGTIFYSDIKRMFPWDIDDEVLLRLVAGMGLRSCQISCKTGPFHFIDLGWGAKDDDSHVHRSVSFWAAGDTEGPSHA